MRVGSLFSGIAGIDLAFERAGAQTQWMVEWDAYCQDVLRYRYPDTPIYGDIDNVNIESLAPIDCLVFGSPCQDLSIAGKGAGLAGSRSSLFFSAIDLLHQLRQRDTSPRYVLWENVPNALSSNAGQDFRAVLEALASLGPLALQWRVLDAQYFGVPQRRRRLFVIADFGSSREQRSITAAFGESSSGSLAEDREAWQAARFAAARSVGRTSSAIDNDSRARVDHEHTGPLREEARAQSMIAYRMLRSDEYVEDEVASCIAARDYKSATDLVVGFSTKNDGSDAQVELGPTARAMNHHHSHLSGGGQVGIAYSKVTRTRGTDAETWDVTELANTLNAFDVGDVRTTQMVLNQYQYVLRRLSVIECERLMGFPDGWTGQGASGKTISNSRRYRMLGNSVAVPCIQWIAERIIKEFQDGLRGEHQGAGLSIDRGTQTPALEAGGG